jgi:hypothetical protein
VIHENINPCLALMIPIGINGMGKANNGNTLYG